MARALSWLVAVVTALVAWPAAALGPLQPFTPPVAAARGADAAAAAPQAATHIGLAGVRLGTSPRALIDGEWVALGQPAREGRLVAVRAHEVVLRLPNGRDEHLPLFPDAPAAAANGSAESTVVMRVLQ